MEDVEELYINMSLSGFVELLRAHWHPKRTGPFYRKTGPFSWEEPYGKNSVRTLYLGRPSSLSKDRRECKVFEHVCWHPRLRLVWRSRHVITLYITRTEEKQVYVEVECHDLRVKDTMYKHFVEELRKLRDRVARPGWEGTQAPPERIAGDRFGPEPATAPGEDSVDKEDLSSRGGMLDAVDRKIVEIVAKLREKGIDPTDELVAMRLPPNPKTSQPYHRVTVNKRRCSLRDRGYKV